MSGLSHEESGQPESVKAKRRSNGKEELARQAAELTSVDFIGRYICPMIAGTALPPKGEWKAEVEQNTGTGRLTLRYEIGPSTILHAKLYTDDLGTRSYRVMKTLWDSGFNSNSIYQVPEPVGFLPLLNFLVMRQVPGKPIAAAVDGDTSMDLLEGCRSAARWLATLHRSSIRVGTPQADWESLKLFRVASRLIKAVSERPEHLDLVRELLDTLRDPIRKLPQSRPIVQTHGRYHHDHVFIGPGTVAVIDLDRCCPSDPGKDVAEFVRVLRSAAFKRDVDMKRIDEATQVFLQEYLSAVPEAAASLSCYWGTFTFHSLLGWLKKSKSKEKENWQELTDFYVREIKLALEVRL